MGLFTRLADRDVAALAEAFGLGTVVGYEPLAAGTINSNFRVATERGSYFLRVNEGKSEDDVAYEVDLVKAFVAGGLPIPPPLHGRDGRRYVGFGDKWVSAFVWRDGRHLAAVTADHAYRLGAALAALHFLGADLPRRRSIYDHEHLVARFASFADSGDPVLTPAIAVLRDELAFLESKAAVRSAASHGVIHGDLFRDNVLWNDDGDIEAILDFEQASGGSFAYDLAVCLNDWCWTGAVRLDLAAALLDGYQLRGKLPPIDREALVIEVRAAAARFTITRVTDVYLATVTNPEKDFRDFLARSEAWRGPALHQLTALM